MQSRGWVIATVVLAVAAVGLGVWAFSLKSDNDDKDAKIASQQQQLDQQQTTAADAAGKLKDAASGIAGDAQQALQDLGTQLDQVQGTATATQQDVDQAINDAQTAAADAKARVQKAGNDALEKAQAQADEASARADEAAACARGYLSAIGSVFDAESITAGVEQAKTDIQGLQGSCADTLGS